MATHPTRGWSFTEAVPAPLGTPSASPAARSSPAVSVPLRLFFINRRLFFDPFPCLKIPPDCDNLDEDFNSTKGQVEMPSEKVVPKRLEGQRLNVEIGTRMMTKFFGNQNAIKAVFVGMEAGAYLVVRLMGVGGLQDYLIEGNEVVVKFISSGVVYGFQSRILGYLFKKSMVLVLLVYPKSVETYELRQETRIESRFPGVLHFGDREYNGYILDMSPSGLRFAIGLTNGNPAADISWGVPVTISFQIPGLEGLRKAACKVRSIQNESKFLAIGLQFDNLAPVLDQDIRRFVEDASLFNEPH